MRKALFYSLMAACGVLASCSGKVQQANYAIIPQPQEVAEAQGAAFKLSGSTVIAYPADNADLQRDAEFLADYVATLTGHQLKLTTDAPSKNAIVLSANLQNENPDAYQLTVNSDLITINGASPAGAFYGVQTLRKSIPAAEQADVEFPAVTITDEPRFSYRGAHFDVSRHFFPLDSVKSFVDMLALHNINRLHWHLTDDQGWRVEIKSRPGLVEKGSMRPQTVIGHNSGEYDGTPHGGYYTQDEIKDLVKYAADRYITVIPEIDLPGHMLGALAAYPELGCTGGPYELWQIWGVSDQVLCAGNDSTYKFLDDVLGEIVELFPSEYIHVGGDECPKRSWEKCPKCQAKIKELGLKADEHGSKEEKLQSHVIHHASDFLASKGRKMIGWDEILEGGLAPGAVVMSWRGEAGGIEAAKRGHDVIMTPNTYLYFDYYQSNDHANEPEAIGGYLPIEKVYSYEPMPEALTPEEAKHIKGVQANLWTEYIPTFSQAQYMELPRMAALSEIQWSKNTEKDFEAFAKRVPQIMKQYDAEGYNYAKHIFNVNGKLTSDPEQGAIVVELMTVDGAPIYYTLDGTEPTKESTVYTQPIVLKETSKINASTLREGGLPNGHFTDSVSFNKATSRAVTLANEPAKNYKAKGGATLVDGRYGTPGYNTGMWVGFLGDGLDATIDLGSAQQVSEVTIHTNVITGDWIFDAADLKVEVSTDGKNFTQVFSEEYAKPSAHVSQIAEHKATFPAVEAQYVRVIADAQTPLPAWHDGAGKPAYLFVDEIEIN